MVDQGVIVVRFGIIGTGSYLPPQVVTNHELAAGLAVSAGWIEERTGVRERRVAPADEATSDLAVRAAQRALDDAGVCPEWVDFVVVGTSTPDHPQPATAALVQAKLAAVYAAAFDVNAVCTSFVYALDVARGLLGADPRARYALVVGADTYSRQLNYTDHKTCVLFGDGAGAVVLGPVDEGHGMLSSRLLTDGRLSELVKVNGGGSRRPLTAEALSAGEHLFTMRGREVRRYVEEVVPSLLEDLLKEAELDLADVDLVVPHQANGVLLRSCFEAMDFPLEKVHMTCSRYGNTAAASVPVTLDDAARTRGIPPGARVVLLGIGGGMSAGASLHRWVGRGAAEHGDLR
jgi:3-oxoacyl-[acyl-carrier-protein] synthase-3